MNTSQTGEGKSGQTEDHIHSFLSKASPIDDPTTGSERFVLKEAGRSADDIPGLVTTCRLDELHPHPSYVRHHLTVPASQLSALAELGDLAFREPIIISRDRVIIDGYARVELARQQGRLTLSCNEYELTEAEALHWLLQRHRRSNGLNAFSRVLLALELEVDFKEKARANQRAGGQNKGSSKLTEAERVDVRSEIAAAAGVGVINVTKVKQLMVTAAPEIPQALFSGEISIHRAWGWRNESPKEQREELRVYQSEKGLKKTIRALISHQSKKSPTMPDLDHLLRRLSTLELGPVSVKVIEVPGKAVFLTGELFRDLGLQEELPCATNSR
jgi:hypothetical protein